MKKIILILAVFISLFACSDSQINLSALRAADYIASANLVSGQWVSDDPQSGSFHYMGFNTDSAGAAALPSVAVFTGLPGNTDSGDISRLEIFNLVENGGFESAITDWDNNGTGATYSRDNTDPNRVNDDAGNNSLKFSISNVTPPAMDIIRFNLSHLRDGFIVNSNYIIRLYYTLGKTDDTLVLEYNNGAPPPGSQICCTWITESETGWIDDNTVYTKFPDYKNIDTNIIAVAGNYFCIGSYNTAYAKVKEGFIDDFRIIKSDQDYYIRLEIPYSESGRPDLHTGTYKFSVYVKGEADADVSPAQNRFRSSRISLGINNKLKGFSSLEYNNASWTKLSVEEFIQINPGDTIELKISSADSTFLTNSLDIGSVLIAGPELEYISN